MQEFTKRIGWARGGLLISAVLLAVMGVLCFVAHGIMPHAMHHPGLPSGYATGELIGAAAMGITGACQLAAFNMAGGSRNLGGFLILEGIMSLVCCLGCLVDPMLGTFSYEWVIAVFIGLLAVVVFLSAVCSGRLIGYKGWLIQAVLALVMIVAALGVVYNSAYAATMAGIAFFAYAIVVALSAIMSKGIMLKY